MIIWYYVGISFSHQQLIGRTLYNKKEIALPIQYCALACNPQPEDHIQEIKKNSVVYGIIKNNIIIIRSTSNCEDMKLTLETSMKHTKYADFHKGYYNRAEIIYNILTTENKFKDVLNNEKIYLIGHSMGGAVGSILGYLLNYNLGRKIYGITFGSPKFATKEYLDYMKENGINLVHYLNYLDPIIYKPTSRKLVRCGKEIYNTQDTGSLFNNHSLRVYSDLYNGIPSKIIKKPSFIDLIGECIFDIIL